MDPWELLVMLDVELLVNLDDGRKDGVLPRTAKDVPLYHLLVLDLMIERFGIVATCRYHGNSLTIYQRVPCFEICYNDHSL